MAESYLYSNFDIPTEEEKESEQLQMTSVEELGRQDAASSDQVVASDGVTTQHEIPPSLRLTLTWDSVVVKHRPKRTFLQRLCGAAAPPEKTILRGVSGLAKPGTLTALMGSSGAGKTTLLNVLNQRCLEGLQVKGQVCLNGQPVSMYGRSIRKLCGYVQQHDILPAQVTVREYLTFCAMLTMSKHLSEEAKKAEVETVLNEFSLRKCAHLQIKGRHAISGGEMKRVSVAIKLFARPRLLFLDEPTTGLDSYMASLLVNNLKSLASRGFNIVCTIHQPSPEIFELFDRVVLLAEGKITYSGPRSQCLSFFSDIGYECPDTFSPADHFIELLTIVPGHEAKSRSRVAKIQKRYEASSYSGTAQKELVYEMERSHGTDAIEDSLSEYQDTGYQTNWLVQLKYITWRGFISLKRDVTLLKTRVGFVALMCIELIMLFWNPTVICNQQTLAATQGIMYFICASFTFVNAYRLIALIPQELPLMIRENLDGMYSVSAYYVGTLISQCTLGAVLQIVSTASVYCLTGLSPNLYTFAMYLVILLLDYLANVAFVSMQAVIWEKPASCVNFIPPQVFIMNIFGGFYINPSSVAPYFMPIVYLDWIHWSFELLSINQWTSVKEIDCGDHLIADTCYETGDQVLEHFGFEAADYRMAFTLVVVHIICYNVIAMLLLSAKMKYKWTG